MGGIHLPGGATVVGIIDENDEDAMVEDLEPVRFLVRDKVSGDVLELQLEIGRMGTYSRFVLPPFKAPVEGDWGEGEAQVEGPRTQTQDDVTARNAEESTRSRVSVRRRRSKKKDKETSDQSSPTPGPEAVPTL